MPVIGSDDLLEYKVPYNENVMKKFNEVLFFKEIISNNILENQKLAELRDWLLPMLMNGQVTVN
jgi:type I restriction enzyme S subunit